ncbi:peroxiredoxin-like 2C isoform X2 [Rattus norvegicus]|uniref:peroxiredoxin-like 2C isoform X2 n=1 Tax=Rattus norvegicus TaxID=10116 RepID=UPI0003D09B9C|nr:peroxiredoxin-like 2C isoform X3 [Rattus norvegicus]|eukprot:XP_017456129.1 PREDICTED: thioredoxin-like protein AAED1 isoform X2 [Rattus norvegicus]
MAAPVTRQVSGCAGRVPSPTGSDTERGQPLAAAVAELPVLDASGRRVTFGALFRERRAVVVFVRHFLCYVCKEYVEDLAKIPKSVLQEADVTLIVIGQSSYHHIEPFCKLTGYSHEIYVDPEREIYKRLGMKRGEEISSSESTSHRSQTRSWRWQRLHCHSCELGMTQMSSTRKMDEDVHGCIIYTHEE